MSRRRRRKIDPHKIAETYYALDDGEMSTARLLQMTADTFGIDDVSIVVDALDEVEAEE